MEKFITLVAQTLGLSQGTAEWMVFVVGIVSGGLSVWAFMRKYITRIEKLVDFHRGVNHDKIVMNGGPAIIDGRVWRRADDELDIHGILTPDQIALARRHVVKEGEFAGIVMIPNEVFRGPIFASLGNKMSSCNNPDHVRIRTGIDRGEVMHYCFLTLEHHTNTPDVVLEKWRIEVATPEMGKYINSDAGANPEFGEKKLSTNWNVHRAAARAYYDMTSEGRKRAEQMFWMRALSSKPE